MVKLQIDKIFKCRSRNNKSSKWKHGRISSEFWHRQEHSQNSEAIKEMSNKFIYVNTKICMTKHHQKKNQKTNDKLEKICIHD